VISKPYVLGIDPGRKGGAAILSIAKPRAIIAIQDLPCNEDGIDAKTFSFFLDTHKDQIRFCVIEKVHAMTYTDSSGQKRGQGAAASFDFGKGFGLILGCLHAMGVPTFEVVPSVWKILLGLGSAKSDSIALAKRLYPMVADKLTLKKHDGRAEALLLAHFGCERFCGGSGK
jgi:crossover junction endodeoxyribonuclease RuvC